MAFSIDPTQITRDVTVESAGSSASGAGPRDLMETLFCDASLLETPCSFIDYRVPNEGTPINVKPHLDLMKKGWIVSTGTERSFYDLILSPEGQCEGLIIRDINPKVKAYCDFLILSLLASDSTEAFRKLLQHSFSTEEQLADLKETIFSKSDLGLSSKRLNYFKTNFELLAKAYLPLTCFIPRDSAGVEYFKEESLFMKLKQYASQGRILTTIGDINDLQFTKDLNVRVTVIDTSNICDYIFLNFSVYDESVNPRVISTIAPLLNTRYFSKEFQKLPPKLIKEYMSLVGTIDNQSNSPALTVKHMVTTYRIRSNIQSEPTNSLPGSCICHDSLAIIQKTCNLKRTPELSNTTQAVISNSTNISDDSQPPSLFYASVTSFFKRWFYFLIWSKTFGLY